MISFGIDSRYFF